MTSDRERRRPHCPILLAGLAWLAGSATAACTAGSAKPPAAVGSLMTATSEKPQYGVGEPVVIAVTLTSREKSPCRMAGVPDGVVTISSMTRDGTAVLPALSEGEYINGFTAVIADNSVAVDPQKAVTMSLTSASSEGAASSTALLSSVQAAGDASFIARWPVDGPGKYVVALTYRMPPVKLPSAACPVSSAPVSVTFIVTGS